MAYEEIYNYLLKKSVKKADYVYPSASLSKFPVFYVTSSVAEFIGAETASAPTGNYPGITVPTSSKNNFLFFVNGDYLDHEAITLCQTGSDLWVFVNNTDLYGDYTGSYLSSDDEVFGWGKFE